MVPTPRLLPTAAQSCTFVFSPAGLNWVSRIKLVSKTPAVHPRASYETSRSLLSLRWDFSPLSNIHNHLLDHEDGVQLDFLHNWKPKAPNSAWLAASPPYYNLLSRLITYSSFHPCLGSLWPISTSSTRPLSLKNMHQIILPQKKQKKQVKKLREFCKLLHRCCVIARCVQVEAQTFAEIFFIQESLCVLSL